MKKVLLMLLPILACVAQLVASCSSDDDNDSGLSFDKNTIVGAWEITSVSSSTWRWINEGSILTFNSNGTCTTGFSMENSYKIEGGVIKTYYKETGEPMFIYTLLSVSSNVYTVKIGGTLDESNKSVIVSMIKE